ncbi:crossover junction endodeoxyribonuclease RuvC [Planctomicrobium sp. SH664]|uniref:crossover junction endodeoxyribonuclease RuvC n=1 Tax=Planctomicrobium sp. SH664 TaxID=3448125 RepID=UPI003F5C83CE
MSVPAWAVGISSQGPSSAVGIKTGNAFAAQPGSIYLGVDPGLNRTGYALLRRTSRRPVLIEGGVIRTKPSGSLASRVLEIGQGISELIEEFQPDSVAIEKVFSMVKNPKTALMMAHARGAILYSIAHAGLGLVHYTPRQIKKLLTGTGTASKEQVQQAIQRELNMTKTLEPNDVADACAIALCHYHSLRVDLHGLALAHQAG